MTHTVAVGEFEGPLGILLDLVERRRLEVTSISVAEITAGYLERIRTLEVRSPEDLGEFLALGARLLYIKSLALLPAPAGTEQTEELRALTLELDEYKRIQAASRELAARTPLRTWARPATPKLSATEVPLPEFELQTLTEAFARALRNAPAQPEPGVIKVTLSQQMVLVRLRRRLENGFELTAILRECGSRLEIIVTFLALLELIRGGAAVAGQSDQFGTIQVSAS